jgi:hypothetical protein
LLSLLAVAEIMAPDKVRLAVAVAEVIVLLLLKIFK